MPLLATVAGCYLDHTVGRPGTSPRDVGPVDVGARDAGAPVADASDPSEVAEIALGTGHSCARRASGEVDCWGNNVDRTLGRATSYFEPNPGPVDSLGAVDAIDASQYLSCAVADGTVWCWGKDIDDLASPPEETGVRPVQVMPPTVIAGVDDAVDVATGRAFGCAIRAGGTVVCFGKNSAGQLGDGTLSGHADAEPLANGPGNVVELALGDHHGCARVQDGRVYCWGAGRSAIGNVDPELLVPRPIEGIEDATSLAAGWWFTCATRTDRSVLCWGNHPAQDSFYTGPVQWPPPPPEPVEGIGEAVALCGTRFVCALRHDATVWCWGPNEAGQLGNGRTSVRGEPGPVANLANVSQIDCGWQHACALTGGRVFCWGANESGQLGTGTFDPSLIPIEVPLP